MKLSGILLLAVISVGILSSQPLTERYAHLGEIIIHPSSYSPFPHAKRDSGHTYNKQRFPSERHYSDSSVAVFIPNGFSPSKSIDMVIYFHGWNNNIDSACAQFRLIEQFSESKKNALFVFPEGPKDSPDSFGGRMEEKDGLKNLVDDVLQFVKSHKKIRHANAGRIILAGHSGAYRVISFCLMRGGMTKNISEVFLFDALYAETEKFARWIDRSKGRFINIYTDDGGTKYETQDLMDDLNGWGIPFVSLEEDRMQPSDLAGKRIVFIHTSLTHNEVIAARSQFRLFLATSSLAGVPPAKKR